MDRARDDDMPRPTDGVDVPSVSVLSGAGIAPPTKAEIENVIATVSKSRAMWKSHPGYARFLDVELFCLRAALERAPTP